MPTVRCACMTHFLNYRCGDVQLYIVNTEHCIMNPLSSTRWYLECNTATVIYFGDLIEAINHQINSIKILCNAITVFLAEIEWRRKTGSIELLLLHNCCSKTIQLSEKELFLRKSIECAKPKFIWPLLRRTIYNSKSNFVKLIYRYEYNVHYC